MFLQNTADLMLEIDIDKVDCLPREKCSTDAMHRSKASVTLLDDLVGKEEFGLWKAVKNERLLLCDLWQERWWHTTDIRE